MNFSLCHYYICLKMTLTHIFPCHIFRGAAPKSMDIWMLTVSQHDNDRCNVGTIDQFLRIGTDRLFLTPILRPFYASLPKRKAYTIWAHMCLEKLHNLTWIDVGGVSSVKSAGFRPVYTIFATLTSWPMSVIFKNCLHIFGASCVDERWRTAWWGNKNCICILLRPHRNLSKDHNNL